VSHSRHPESFTDVHVIGFGSGLPVQAGQQF
jgi:hypothetical protein